MTRIALAAALALLPLAAHAQAPPTPSAQAQFAAQLATLLSDTIAERDAARTQLAACQAKATPAPSTEPPKP